MASHRRSNALSEWTLSRRRTVHESKGPQRPKPVPFDSPTASPPASRRRPERGRRASESKRRHAHGEPSKGFSSPLRRCHRRLAVHYIYILRCADDSLYVGETSDVGARVLRHQAGEGSGFTRQRLPVTLVHAEQHADRRALA
ncbi:MAG: GIY-YIG nuclease family protein [Luteitalea sp.]